VQEKVIKVYIVADNNAVPVEVQQQDTVSTLKMKAAQMMSADVSRFTLKFKNHTLDESKRVMDCGIKNKAKVEVINV
jgi:Ubiquitin family